MAGIDPNDKAEAKAAELETAAVSLLQTLRDHEDVDQCLAQAIALCGMAQRHLSYVDKFRTFVKEPELDLVGTQLYNAALRKRHDPTFSTELTSQLLLAALLLLEAGMQSTRQRDNGGTARVFRVYLKASNICKELMQLDRAKELLERAAAHLEWLTELRNADASSPHTLVVKFHVARADLAVLSNETSVAVFALQQALQSADHLADAGTALLIYQALFKLGTVLQKSGQIERAIEQYRKCYDKLSDGSSTDKEVDLLREECLRNLAACHLSRGKTHDIVEAAKLADLAGDEWPRASWLLMLRVDVALKCHPDPPRTAKLLITAIKLTEVDYASVDRILQRCRSLAESSIAAVIECLDALSPRLSSSDIQSVSLLLAHRVWFSTRSDASQEEMILVNLELALNSIPSGQRVGIDWQTRQACQLLLWRASEARLQQQQWLSALGWCRLAAHPLLDTGDSQNNAKIARRIAQCNLELGNPAQAVIALQALGDDKSALACQILFSAKLRQGDIAGCTTVFDTMGQYSDCRPDMLFACIQEARAANQAQLAIDLLAHQLEAENTSKLAGSDSQLSFRKLIIRQTLELNDATNAAQTAKTLNEQFAAVAAVATDPVLASRASCTVDELEWFSRHGHNIALDNISQWTMFHILELLLSTIKILEAYPATIDKQVWAEYELRRLHDYYAATSIATLIARHAHEDNARGQYYRQCHALAKTYILRIEQSAPLRVDIEQWPDRIHEQLGSVLVFDFEAACTLAMWDTLVELIGFALDHHLARQCLPVMADLLLQIADALPPDLLAKELDRISDALNATGKFSIVRAAHWHRVLLDTYLDAEVFIDTQRPSAWRGETLLVCQQKLMDKVTDLAHSHRRDYPTDTLQYLATRSVNHAIELTNRNDAAGCQKWCDWALRLSQASNDMAFRNSIENVFHEIFVPSPDASEANADDAASKRGDRDEAMIIVPDEQENDIDLQQLATVRQKR